MVFFAEGSLLTITCIARLQQAVKKPASQALGANDVKGLVMLVFIVSLLGEHFAFDTLRKDNEAMAKELNTITEVRFTLENLRR